MINLKVKKKEIELVNQTRMRELVDLGELNSRDFNCKIKTPQNPPEKCIKILFYNIIIDLNYEKIELTFSSKDTCLSKRKDKNKPELTIMVDTQAGVVKRREALHSNIVT